jgi:hypothetical protein
MAGHILHKAAPAAAGQQAPPAAAAAHASCTQSSWFVYKITPNNSFKAVGALQDSYKPKLACSTFRDGIGTG